MSNNETLLVRKLSSSESYLASALKLPFKEKYSLDHRNVTNQDEVTLVSHNV